jgi:hypothetical protein
MYQSEYPKEVRKVAQYLLILILVSLGFFIPSKVKAITISPAYSETYSSYEEQISKSFTVKNDNDYDIYLRPKIYKYYPPADYISIPEKHEEFTIVDTDVITIPANSQKEIGYQIYAKPSFEYGTYYNLIALEIQSSLSQEAVGAVPVISFLSVIHITDKDIKGESITDQFSMDIEVIKKGLPFIMPAKIKVAIFNNSKYTLRPIGEVQSVTYKQKQEPEYVKINIDRERIFPNDEYEQTIELKKWHIQDIFFSKTIYTKLYNGLDETFITKEVTLPTYKNELLYTLVILMVIYGLLKSVKRDVKQS